MGVTTKLATPEALVTAVDASKLLSPKPVAAATTVPAATGTAAASLTMREILAGEAAVTAELLMLASAIDGVSASNCTTTVPCTKMLPTVADAVTVSAALTVGSAVVTVVVAVPKPSLIAELAPSLTRPDAELKFTWTSFTVAPAAFLTTARSVAAPVEPRKVVELMVRPTVGTDPLTVKLALPCTLGTGTGLSTAWILCGTDAASTRMSVDVDRAVQSIVVKYLEQDRRIRSQLADGSLLLENLAGREFDFIFAA